jgi:hypothetical protein
MINIEPVACRSWKALELNWRAFIVTELPAFLGLPLLIYMQAIVSALASVMKMCPVEIKGQTHRPSSSIQPTR